MNKTTVAQQAKTTSVLSPPQGVLQRKCACGNSTFASGECAECAKKKGMLQRKLSIGASNDPLELEADRIADQVMASLGHSVTSRAPLHIQRFTRQAIEGTDTASASVDRALAGSGRPLEPALRIDMEQRFGHDFSQVRVHSDGTAEQSAKEVNANAYTVGHNIVFDSGRFAPGTHKGRRLIAHELAHVVQQSSSSMLGTIQRDEAGGGSTEFKDTVTVMSRPTSGPGVISGTVTRTETAPASGSQPRQQIHSGEMHVSFAPSDCSVTIPFGYNFVQAAQATGTGICEDPPNTTKVPLLSAARFNRIKATVLADVNRGLNGWFDVRLSGGACPTGCADKTLPIRVVAREDTANSDTTITVVNRGGRADAATICAASWKTSTAVHEGGHQVLGVGDEYPEQDERLRATVPQWFRRERVRRDYSVMGPGPESDSRFAMFHQRHFNAVKTFLESAFPRCTATLLARPRPILPDYRIVLGGGYASLSGVSGQFLEAGLRIGIPLDRLRRWELVLGPQINWMSAIGDQRSQDAFLLGARLGIEGSTGGSGHGLTAGAFGEAGYGWFSSSDYGAGGGSRSAKGGYGELGLGIGYRTPILGRPGSTRFDFRLEGAAGSALGAPGIIGPITREIESDPARSYWFRLGITVGGQF
ncbi:MAG: eCIS core domain-containing protein [Methylobacter sp.]